MSSDILSRLLEGIERAGVKHGARNKTVAEKTGYAAGTVARILSGNAILTERFIQSACSAFVIDKNWVLTGKASTALVSPGAINQNLTFIEKIAEAGIDLEKLIGIFPLDFLKALKDLVIREALIEMMKMSVPKRWEAVGMLKQMNEPKEDK